MNKLQFFGSIFLLMCSACIPRQAVKNAHEVKTCYKAVFENHTYIIGFFEDNTFVFGRDMGQKISLGTYERTIEEVILSSYIQSLDKIPFVVKESYKANQEGTLLNLSMVSGLFFLGAWTGYVPTEIDLDGFSCSNNLPITPVDFDSVYTIQCAQEKGSILSFSSRTLNTLEYKVKDSRNNHFECYYLDFSPSQFCVLSGVKGKIQKNKIQIPAYLLDDEVKDKSLVLNFEEVKEIRTRVGLNSTAEGAMLSAYYSFTQAGRLALINE